MLVLGICSRINIARNYYLSTMAQTYDGAGQDYKRGKYTVEKHRYPDDLDAETNNQYGGHKVVFYINVAGGGKIARGDEGMSTIDMPQSRFGEFAGTKAQRTDPIKSNLALTAGAIKSNGVTGAAGASVLLSSSPKKRLTTAICLYVPESLTKSYNVNWGQENSEKMMEMAAAQQILSSTTGKGAALVGVSLAQSKGLADQSYLQKTAGVSPGNSKAEFLFSGVEFGSFTFDYRFAPRSSEEAANVLNIVRTFRHHMLPEFYDDANFLYIYPSEFEVRYYIKDKENDFLERHMTAVLKGMNINYTSNNQMTTFADGMPTNINMTLQFQELAMPSKETSPADKPGA